MTTLTSIPTPAQAPVASRLTFDGVVKGEWTKLLSLRSIRWSIAVMLLLSWLGAAMLALAMTGVGVTPEAIPALITQSATFGSMFTVLVMGVIGVLSITSEYASGMIVSSMMAVPRRTPLLLAKALVVAALGFSVGAISSFGGGAISALMYGGDGIGALFDPSVLVSLLGNAVYLTLAALLALGIGAMLRSSAGAISVVVTLFFVLTIVLQVMLMTGWEWVPAVANWMPASLGATVSTVALEDTVPPGTVTYWGAMGGLSAWALAALVPALVLFKKRDAV